MALGRVTWIVIAHCAWSGTALLQLAHAEVFVGPASVCAQRVAALEGLFRKAESRPDTSAFLPVTAGFDQPVMAAGDAPAQFTGLVEWGPSGVRFDGRPVETATKVDGPTLAAAIAREVESGREGWRLMHPKEKAPRPRLGLWLDRRLGATDAWTLIELLSKKADIVVLGVTTDSARPARQLPEPVSQQIASIRATTDFIQKSALISKAASQSLAGCTGHEQYFKQPAEAALSQKGLRRAMISALKGCSCKGADLDLLEAIAVPELDQPLVTSRVVRPQEKGKAGVTLPRSATVQDLVQRLPRSGTFGLRWETIP